MVTILAILYMLALVFFQSSTVVATCLKIFANSFIKCLDIIKPKLFTNYKDVIAE